MLMILKGIFFMHLTKDDRYTIENKQEKLLTNIGQVFQEKLEITI